jgi:RNA polymerase sigma factor (sigma-70 family)
MDPLRTALNSKEDREELTKQVFMRCMAITMDREEARDLAQETILKGLEKINQFDGKNLQAWLSAIAKNTHIDKLRKSKNKNAEKIIGEFKGLDVNGIDSEFTLKEEAKDLLWVRVYINDVFQPQENYSISGTSLKFSTPPKKDSVIKIIKYKGPTGLESLESEHVEGDQEASIIKDEIERCMKKLSEEDREIIALLPISTNDEMAEALEISSNNMRVKISRARSKLAECLEIAA